MTVASHNYFQRQIEEHFEDLELDLVVRKRKRGYNIYWADDLDPVARLRPAGRDDVVEVEWWDGTRWAPVGEFGVALPLDEALNYISDDPDDLFFEEASEDEDDEDAEDDEDDEDDDQDDPIAPQRMPTNTRLVDAIQIIQRFFLASAVIGAVAGCICSSPPWGLLAGGITGFLCFAVSTLVFTRGRGISVILKFSTFALLPAAVGGTTGAAVHGGLGGGVWALACGMAAGGVGTALLCRGGLWAWIMGLTAGLNLGVYLVHSWQLDQRYFGFALVVILSALGAAICRVAMTGFANLPIFRVVRGGQSSEPLQTWRSLDSLRRAGS